MPFSALFTNLAFYHLSLLAFLVGAQIYQSFFANIAASNALSRSQFRILQASIWPMYFKLQMIASLLLALTYPGGGAEDAPFRGSASAQGLLDADNRSTVLLPLATMVVLSTANALAVVPKTISLMWKLHVETVREEKARGITGPRPQEDEKVNFGTPAAQTFERGIPADHVSQYLRATAKRS